MEGRRECVPVRRRRRAGCGPRAGWPARRRPAAPPAHPARPAPAARRACARAAQRRSPPAPAAGHRPAGRVADTARPAHPGEHGQGVVARRGLGDLPLELVRGVSGYLALGRRFGWLGSPGHPPSARGVPSPREEGGCDRDVAASGPATRMYMCSWVTRSMAGRSMLPVSELAIKIRFLVIVPARCHAPATSCIVRIRDALAVSSRSDTSSLVGCSPVLPIRQTPWSHGRPATGQVLTGHAGPVRAVAAKLGGHVGGGRARSTATAVSGWSRSPRRPRRGCRR